MLSSQKVLITGWLLLLGLTRIFTYGQPDSNHYCIAFYNVENLFHPSKDSIHHDDAFTPDGLYHWSYKKYHRKIYYIAKVMIALGKGNAPDIIGLAEIENKRVLDDLCKRSPLKKYHYQSIHYDSGDRRGIDVAMLYRKDRIKILNAAPIKITFPFEPQSENRDILSVMIQLPNHDTLYVFVNHWTSRYGGYAATIPKRNFYASVLKEKTDSLYSRFSNPYILIMGDFNDYPDNESMHNILKARSPEEMDKSHLINLMYDYHEMANTGSHKYEDFWGCLDQIIVSGNLLKCGFSLKIIDKKAHILKEPFMVTPDEKYGGDKPFRTFSGPRYLGGYSDHLPVFIRLIMQHPQ